MQDDTLIGIDYVFESIDPNNAPAIIEFSKVAFDDEYELQKALCDKS